jgi:hypothetical protein
MLAGIPNQEHYVRGRPPQREGSYGASGLLTAYPHFEYGSDLISPRRLAPVHVAVLASGLSLGRYAAIDPQHSWKKVCHAVGARRHFLPIVSSITLESIQNCERKQSETGRAVLVHYVEQQTHTLAEKRAAAALYVAKRLNRQQNVWSWREESNLQPAVYKTAALPIELRQHVRSIAELRMTVNGSHVGSAAAFTMVRPLYGT